MSASSVFCEVFAWVDIWHIIDGDYGILRRMAMC